jgi:hypothetical protein
VRVLILLPACAASPATRATPAPPAPPSPPEQAAPASDPAPSPAAPSCDSAEPAWESAPEEAPASSLDGEAELSPGSPATLHALLSDASLCGEAGPTAHASTAAMLGNAAAERGALPCPRCLASLP